MAISTQSPAVMSLTMPPLAAMMVAIRRSAPSLVWVLAGSLRQNATSAANPSGSRLRAISAVRICTVPGFSSHDRLGRITSPLISGKIPPPRASKSFFGLWQSKPSRCSHSIARRRQAMLPAASAPLTSHRSCQVRPGCCSSQRRILPRPTLRRACVSGTSRVSGGASSRASTTSRDRPVAGHVDAGRRGGNCLSSAAAAGPSRRSSRARARVCAVTPCPPRTGRSASPADTTPPAGSPMSRTAALPGLLGARGGRARPRSRPRAGRHISLGGAEQRVAKYPLHVGQRHLGVAGHPVGGGVPQIVQGPVGAQHGVGPAEHPVGGVIGQRPERPSQRPPQWLVGLGGDQAGICA